MEPSAPDRRTASLCALAFAGALIALAIAVAFIDTVPFRERAAAFRELLGSPVRLQHNVLLGASITGFALLAFAMIRAPRRSLSTRIAPWLLAVSIACGCAGVAAHLFSRADYFDVGDNANYYVGAKYARELRYDRHYECFATALDGLGRNVPERYRDLRDNRVRKLRKALATGKRELCLKSFSSARWQAFQQDMVAYRAWQDFRTLERRFRDHGYNGTPVWSAVAGTIANAVPVTATNQTLVALLNLVFLAAGLGLVIRAFGWELGLFYVLLFWIQYADRFGLGGAFLRYLNISLLCAGAALYKLARPAWAGACIGLAAGLLVFPGLFLAAATAYLVLSVASSRTFTAGDKVVFRFLFAAGCALVLGVLLSVLYTGGLEAWPAFFEKMQLNSGRFATGRIGFIFNFLWPKPITTDPAGYEVGLAVLHSPGPLGLSFNHLRLLLGGLLIGALAYAYRKADALTFMLILGFALFFVCFPTVRYYYTGIVALPLALHAAPSSHSARAILAALCALNGACYLLHAHTSHAFLHNTLLTMGFTALLIALAVPKLAQSLRAPA